MFVKLLKAVVVFLERAISVTLVLLIVLALAGLLGSVVQAALHDPLLDAEEVLHLVDHVLVVFVLIELFAIALAYARGQEVLRTVLEAAFVAVARKLIAFEPGPDALGKGAALAMVCLAIAATWLILHRLGVTEGSSGGTGGEA